MRADKDHFEQPAARSEPLCKARLTEQRPNISLHSELGLHVALSKRPTSSRDKNYHNIINTHINVTTVYKVILHVSLLYL